MRRRACQGRALKCSPRWSKHPWRQRPEWNSEESLKVVRELAEGVYKAAGKEAVAVAKADDLITHIHSIRGGEAAAFKALNATDDEIIALRSAAEAGRIEATAEAVGEAVETVGRSKLTLTRTGNLYSCSSPCSILREKYAHVLLKDSELQSDLKALEGRARFVGPQAAAEEAAAAAGQPAARTAPGVTTAVQEAEYIKTEAVALETRLRAREIQMGLDALAPKYTVLKNLGLDAAAVERVLAKKTGGPYEGAVAGGASGRRRPPDAGKTRPAGRRSRATGPTRRLSLSRGTASPTKVAHSLPTASLPSRRGRTTTR